jgi:hypothetical protein
MEIPTPIGQHEIYWPEPPEAPRWVLIFRFGILAGRIECIGLDIRPFSTETFEPLRATTMRFPLARFLETARAEVLEEIPRRAEMSDEEIEFLTSIAGTMYDHRDQVEIRVVDEDEVPQDGGERYRLLVEQTGISKRSEGAERFVADLASFMRRKRESAKQISPVLAELDGPRKPGRQPIYGEAHWAQVAEVYATAFAGGDRSPTRTVEKRFTVSRSTARSWVARARREGMLTEAPGPKQAGGEITDEAKAILEELRRDDDGER